MRIIPLSEGSFTIDSTREFIPFKAKADHLSDRPSGSLLVEIQPFAVITSTDIILFDTGLGFIQNGKMQLHSNLLANKIAPEDVTKVFISHLHKDHAGGICNKSIDGSTTLSLPNATYYVHEKELEYALKTGKPSYVENDFNLVINNPQLKMLSGESGNLGNISFEISGGHCPFHSVFWVKEQSDTVFFGGDVAPQLQQMKHKFIAKYDWDGKLSMEKRVSWWKQAHSEGWIFMFYHDINTPTFP